MIFRRPREKYGLCVRTVFSAFGLGLCLNLAACSRPVPGPDKQMASAVLNAAAGAGSGAVTGFQVGAGSGPGAAVGAGVGAIAGAIKGASIDSVEDDMLRVAAETQHQRKISVAQEQLADHFKRRLALHPGRDIYPADLFFYGDEYKLKSDAVALVNEIALINKTRVPWSRLVVAAYVKSHDDESEFALRLGERRARSICDQLTRSGLNPRRLETRVVLMKTPLVVDPHDDPLRYSQAIELIPVDK